MCVWKGKQLGKKNMIWCGFFIYWEREREWESERECVWNAIV